ncbi:hypothetical protein [Piscinibacter sakaiensis]|uniref:hypothetical protein n=1 Tax=Piscinibacter sakaiensis TaxID=1547922 RepID=UPI003AAB8B53
MSQDKNQGEGNVEAARRYDQSQQQFVQSGKVDEAAKKAAPESEQQKRELEQAEEKGRSHAKGEDPTVPGANASNRSEQH